MTLEGLSWFVDDTVMRDLQGVKGVGQVQRVGGVTREIQVDLDPDRLAALGITAGDVNNAAARDQRRPLRRPRRARARRNRRSAPWAAPARSTSSPRPGSSCPAAARRGCPTSRRVEDGYEEPRDFARMDGTTPVVSFSIFRAKGASDVTVAEDVRRAPGRARRRASGCQLHADRRRRARDQGQLQLGDGEPDRGRRAGHRRRAAVPAQLARHAARGDRPAALRSSRPSRRCR